MLVSAPVSSRVVPGSPGNVPLPQPAVQASVLAAQQTIGVGTEAVLLGLSVAIAPFQRLLVKWEVGGTQNTSGGGVQFGVQLPGDGNVVNVLGVVFGQGVGTTVGNGSGPGSVLAFIGTNNNWKTFAATVVGLFQAGPTAGTVDLLWAANNGGTVTAPVGSSVLAVEC